ncbi:MAG: HEAT repeat domain-containing protein [Allosphingosinicella sp.]|uniref:HEAT repeat domain-containing protein n=1 Tax=Allosphingosinicella sp. TaxID=2823234 RepID=UPI0039266126
MSALATLWFVSLSIAGAALLIMFGLLIGRLVLGITGRAREAERRRLVPLLLGARQGELDRRVPGELLAQLSLELIHLVRGSDRERFVSTATRMGVPARLRHHLGSGSPRVRLAAAEALSEFADERSTERLRAALDDRSPDVRLSAALALASAGKAPPARELVDRLRIGTEENSLLTVSLFREIAKARPEEVKALILDETVPAGAKAAAIESLSASGDYALVPVIATLAATAEAADPALPRYLAALGAFGHPAAQPAVKRGLASPEWEVRAAAAEAAGRIGLQDLAPWLKEMLGDDQWWVRFRAAEALARLGPDCARLLREAAEQGAEPARSAGILTLLERGLA